MIRRSTTKLIIYSIIFLIFLVSCAKSEASPPNPCGAEDINEFITDMDDITSRFEEASLLKENTPSEELGSIIKEMQAIERKLDAINTPSCALHTKAALENYFSSNIQCYFYIYATEISEKVPSNDAIWCDLAADQLAYYEAQMDALLKE